jgi:hypothetical protein
LYHFTGTTCGVMFLISNEEKKNSTNRKVAKEKEEKVKK